MYLFSFKDCLDFVLGETEEVKGKIMLKTEVSNCNGSQECDGSMA